MILEFDLGNTSAKWRLLEAGDVVERGRITELDSFVPPSAGKIGAVRVASVAGEAREQALSQWCQNTVGLGPRIARTTAHCSGVSCAYAEPHRLGVDRWLAVLAAYHHCPQGALILDAGTALTIDLVNRRGQHLGGYILPGQQLMQTSLRQDTARIVYAETAEPALNPGCSTAEAVVNGAALSAAAVAQAALQQARTLLGESCGAFITGGDAELILRLLGEKAGDFAYYPDLVMEGLARACPIIE
nr:type III pantothenate kinase [Litorivivens lipolytica]